MVILEMEVLAQNRFYDTLRIFYTPPMDNVYVDIR